MWLIIHTAAISSLSIVYYLEGDWFYIPWILLCVGGLIQEAKNVIKII